VKGRNAGRMVVTDQIAARLAHAIDAPVPACVLVDIPQELVDASPQMAHLAVGLAHGSRWVSGCSERQGFIHADVLENRNRFSRLAIFYGWLIASDHQFIYENAPPHAVHSVDHGHFFDGSTAWTEETLKNAPSAGPDATVVAGCSITQDELDSATAAMSYPSDADIALAVAHPPEEWGISRAEREALVHYLAQRRDVVFSVANEEEA